MRTLLILSCLAAATAGAETYDAWEHAAGVTTGRVTVCYAPWPGFGFGNEPELSRTHGGYEGDLALQATPGVRLKLPLRVTVGYAGVRNEERGVVPGRRRKAAGDEAWKLALVPYSNSWAQVDAGGAAEGSPLPVRPETLVRETMAEVVTVVPALSNGEACVSFGVVHLPVWCPRDGVSLIAARYEVTDSEGGILARGVLPQLLPAGCVNLSSYSPAGGAWVTGDEEADRLLRERCGLHTEETVCPLPQQDAAYDGLQAIWVSRTVWDQTAGGDRFWQRRLLQGVSLFGRPGTVQAMRGTLDPTANGVLLAAQLAGVATTGGEPRASIAAPACYGGYGNGGLDLQCGVNGRFEESLLENTDPLFTHFEQYAGWTVVVLGLFTLGTVVVLALAFVRLRGTRRTALWWALPVWALFFAIVGGGAGRFALARRPRADVTEYRYAHLGWPDMYCRAQGRMLRFDEHPAVWHMPADAMESPAAAVTHARLPGRGTPRLVRAPDAVTYALGGVRAGTFSAVGASWFRPCDLPLEVVGTGSGRRVRARVELARVLVWSRGVWHDCGAVPAGQEARINPAEKGMDRVPGLPSALAACWSKGCQMYNARDAQECDGGGPVVRPVPAAADTWLVVALQRTPPDLQATDARVETTGRVVWILQCP